MNEARKGLGPKTAVQRVAKLRAGLESKGIKRWELSPPPHPDDRPAIKAFAQKLADKRTKAAAVVLRKLKKDTKP